MKNLINSIAWSGLILSLLFTIGCSKKSDPKPIIPTIPVATNSISIQQYILKIIYESNSTDSMTYSQMVEDTIYLVNKVDLTSPLVEGHTYHDTLHGVVDIYNQYKFNQDIIGTTNNYIGSWKIQPNNDLQLNFSEYWGKSTAPDNKLIHRYSIIYTKL